MIQAANTQTHTVVLEDIPSALYADLIEAARQEDMTLEAYIHSILRSIPSPESVYREVPEAEWNDDELWDMNDEPVSRIWDEDDEWN